MGDIAANTQHDHYVDQDIREYPVAASQNIYKGTLCGLDAGGDVEHLTAGNVCVGLAYEQVDNSSGADAAKDVRVYTKGDFKMTLASAAKTDVGAKIYASDSGTLTKTSTSNTLVGVCVGYVTTDTIILRLDPFGLL